MRHTKLRPPFLSAQSSRDLAGSTPRSARSPFFIVVIVIAFGVLVGAGCNGCGTPAAADAGVVDGDPCERNSECEIGWRCEDNVCVEGFPEGSCAEDDDCPGEEICIFPAGLGGDVGICINPHDCDVDGDCDDGQICGDSNDDGYRDCFYDGCEEDAECVVELEGACGLNEGARCIARACLCQDLCGAPCGEERQCCVSADVPMCIDDPGPCSQLTCDPGFIGTASSFGDWSAPQCDYLDSVCACEERPPLELGAIGAPHVLVTDHTGAVFAVAYNSTYGDIVLAAVPSSAPGAVGDWTFIAGVPEAGEDAPIVAGPSGPRGGIEAPGDDVGRDLDAAFDAAGVLHIVARDLTHQALVHLSGTPGAAFTSAVLDAEGDAGYGAHIAFAEDGTTIVAHVARRTSGGDAELRVLASADASAPWQSYVLDELDLSTVACEGGCAVGEVCPAVPMGQIAQCVTQGDDCSGCGATQVCTTQGCRNAADAAPAANARVLDQLDLYVTNALSFAIVGHDPRAGTLRTFRRSGGDVLAGDATFTEAVAWSSADGAVGKNPALQKDGTRYQVASATDERTLTFREYSLTFGTAFTTDIIDDGVRTAASGAENSHIVDVPAMVPTDEGLVVAWQDGTDGNVYAMMRATDDTYGPRQIIGGPALSVDYDGAVGFALSGAMVGSDPVITAQRALLSAEPSVQELRVLEPLLTCPDDDSYEPNDDADAASAQAFPVVLRGILCDDDEDHFEVTLPAACTLRASLLFDDDIGDVDLRVYDAGDIQVASGVSADDNEFVNEDLTAAGTYRFRVDPFGMAPDDGPVSNAYTLRIDCE